jgi:hypothetical protein
LGGIRTRLALVIVGLVAITVLTIGVGTYVFVDARLRDGLLADAARQAQFDLSVLVPGSLPGGTTADTFPATGLPAAFRLRGDVEEIVDFGDGKPYYSDAALSGALEALPADLRSTVSAGHLGFAWQTLAGRPVLVVAGLAAAGPAIYFVFPAGSIDTALGQLRLGLGVAAAVALLLAIGTLSRCSSSVLPSYQGIASLRCTTLSPFSALIGMKRTPLKPSGAKKFANSSRMRLKTSWL